MQDNRSEKRFKTAGARILRPRRLPKDFFSSYDRKLTSSGSLHHAPRDQEKVEGKYPSIFEFTFMAKEPCSLRKTKSNLSESFSRKHTYFPALKRSEVEKENGSGCLPAIKKDSAAWRTKEPEEETPPKRKLQKKSLAEFNR